MKEYDFSKISDEDLETAVVHHVEGEGLAYTFCYGISCRNCPFNMDETSCYEKPDKIRKACREELERRNELKENERPELRAMDIVKLKNKGDDLYMVLPNGSGVLSLYTYPIGSGQYPSKWFDLIVEIQRVEVMYNYFKFMKGDLERTYKTVWKATPDKTPEQQKLEELEETIKGASETNEKAKSQIQE